MAKKQFLDSSGLEELVKHIPQIIAGDNIILTPDATKTNKITISSNSSGVEFATVSEIDSLFT